MKRRLLDGAFIGALLMASLVAVWYLGWKLAGLPFLAFDVFDWTARVLPGSIVTAAIDSMVSTSQMLALANTSTAAKSAEEALALFTIVLAGTAAGSLFFSVLGLSDEPPRLFGAILGGILGIAALGIEHSLRRIAAGSVVASMWIVGTCLAWGLTFGWVCMRLREKSIEPAEGPRHDGDRTDRRRFLIRFAYATAGSTVLTALWGAVIGGRRPSPMGRRWSDDHRLPNAGAAVIPVPGTRRELTRLEDHYRIDVDTRMPTIDAAQWRLRIGGLVVHPLELTLDDLRREEPLHQFVTLSCISNPIGGDLIGTTRWTGVSLQRLLGRTGAQPTATNVKITSADGFVEVLAVKTIRQDPRVMLAYAWDGVQLLPEHGFPVRIYIPDVYGMKQPKWIVTIEVIDHWEPGYWVQRGWDRDGRVKATSTVDAVDVRRRAPDSDGRTFVATGGVAYAGARRISTVETRVDDGEWGPARLREPLSDTSWVVWRADLSARSGEHIVSVRCHDGDGTPQSDGFHSKRMRLP